MGNMVDYLLASTGGGSAAPVPVGSLAAAFSAAQGSGTAPGSAPGAAAASAKSGGTGAGTTPPASIDPLAVNGLVPISPQDEMNPANFFNAGGNPFEQVFPLQYPTIGNTPNPLVQALQPAPADVAAASYPDANGYYRQTGADSYYAAGAIPYASENNPLYTVGADGFAHLDPAGSSVVGQIKGWGAQYQQAAERAQGGFWNSTFGQLLAGVAPIVTGALGFFAAPATAAAAGALSGATGAGSAATDVALTAAEHAALGAGMSWATGGNPLAGALGGALTGGIGGIGDVIAPGLGGIASLGAQTIMGGINAQNRLGPAVSGGASSVPAPSARIPATTGLSANDWWPGATNVNSAGGSGG